MTTTPSAPTADELGRRCVDDGELRLAARYWTGGIRLEVGELHTGVTFAEGVPVSGVPADGEGVVTISGPADEWAPLLATVPPRFKNDVAVAVNPTPANAKLRSGSVFVPWAQTSAEQPPSHGASCASASSRPSALKCLASELSG